MIYSKKILGTVAYLGGLPSVLEKFCWAWGQMIQFNAEYLANTGQGEIIHYTKATVSLHSFARNSIVEQAKGDWLLMLDTDHQFDPDICLRMVKALNKYGVDVLSAVYCHRTPPRSPVLYQWNDDGDTLAPIGDWDRKAGVFQIGSAGAGALMVRTSVFEQIKDELHESPFEIITPFGEDHSFFKRLKHLGIKAYAIPAIESPHINVGTVTLDDYDTSGLTFNQRKEIEAFV